MFKIQSYNEKPRSYFSNIRYDIINLVTDKSKNVLEVGCGEGDTLLELKKLGKADYVVGIDIIGLGQEKYLDLFYKMDVEEESLPFSEGFFDVIICGDVLEHLLDPWSTVKKLRKYLKDGGYLIASIPNIRERSTMRTIFLKGDFKYVDSGILDKTHLRFFCKKNMLEMFKNANFTIETITFNIGRRERLLCDLTFGLLEEFVVPQYIIKVKK